MTPVLVGTYRKRTHIETCLRSIEQHLTGTSELVFVDDSGDTAHSAWLAQYGKVAEVGRRGYTAAMHIMCAAAAGRESFVLEEDFTLTQPVSLEQLHEILWYRPYLAQIALLRGPHFPNEHRAGGLIEALAEKGHQFRTVAGIIEHSATFTGNPSLWRGDVFTRGWPRCAMSEDAKRDTLLAAGYRFGYLPGVRCAHHGMRSGFGY